ncbi:MAG TPA: diacylglycerol kinase family protein [Verrucomicrobiae bacterium]|nr:diacylglycerol kinase family protein [Verrucomicrobiae bacterium]
MAIQADGTQMNDGLSSAYPESGRSQSKRVLVVFNPKAGRRRLGKLRRTIAAMRLTGAKVELLATEARGDAERLAREACGGMNGFAALDLLAIAGGDGTINEAVNGLMSVSGAGATSSLPLCIVPLGTANVLAREIGQRFSPAVAARTALRGRQRQVFLGQANGRCFTIMAGVGFDAHVVANVSTALKQRVGKLAYVWEAFRQLFLFPYSRYRVTVDGKAYDAASVVVAKGRLYAGPYVAAPEARLDSPEFQVCLFLRGGRWNAIRYALALTLGLLPRLKGYRIVSGREVRIDGPMGDPVQGDGDIIAHLPVEIRLAPVSLSLMAPAILPR